MSAEQYDQERLDAVFQRLQAEAGGAPVVVLIPVNDGAIVGIAPAGHTTVAAFHHLRIGSLSPASRWLRHDPPTPVELEQAIEVIEDAVMPLVRQIHSGSMFFVKPGVPELLRPSLADEAGESARLSIDQVEALFSQLAADAHRRSGMTCGTPGGTAFAWQLLVLREAMHHWGFTEVRVR